MGDDGCDAMSRNRRPDQQRELSGQSMPNRGHDAGHDNLDSRRDVDVK